MYEHILIATDGSAYSLKAARHGLALAKSEGARVTVLMVTEPWDAIDLSEIAVGRFEEEYARRSAANAARCLAEVRALAAELGVACETLHRVGYPPYEVIIAVAGEKGCDLIVVGSHGRRGLESLILGSQAAKTLVYSRVPVLVYRE